MWMLRAESVVAGLCWLGLLLLSSCHALCATAGPNTYEESISELEGAFADVDCTLEYAYAVAGACDEGLLFTVKSTGFEYEARFYNASSRAFHGIIWGADYIGLFCGGSGSWPQRIRCTNPTVNEVICGNSISVGDPIEFP